MTSAAPHGAVISHWSTLIENLQASPLQFYEAVEWALVRRQIPETKNDRVDYKEAGLHSAKREYLRIGREKLVFDVCAAPFGTGFFVSWWLTEKKRNLNPLLRILALLVMVGVLGWTLRQMGLFLGTVVICVLIPAALATINHFSRAGVVSDDFVQSLPAVGWLYVWLFKPDTYYRIDTMMMFQKAAHNAVLEVIDEMTAAKGVRALAEMDRKPVMREFYERKAA